MNLVIVKVLINDRIIFVIFCMKSWFDYQLKNTHLLYNVMQDECVLVITWNTKFCGQ
ncbi:hypothetical protein HanIR_Chr05g0254131 [Helianthus annuus]|nr:hypothetical protein HanIR_Chr05g0254131 [Helianthus annuus]